MAFRLRTIASRHLLVAKPQTRVAFLSRHGQVRFASRWSKVEMGPKDPILGVTEKYNEDTNPNKLNLGVGAYRDDHGKPVVLRSVQTAQRRIVDQHMNNEYAPIAGHKDFTNHALSLCYGNASALKEKRIAGVQALSGTGALRLWGEFVHRFGEKPSQIMYLPDPTWGNHIPIYKDAGMDIKRYRYYDPKTRGLNINGLLEDIAAAPNNSSFLFHACAHNPTGVDPKPEQWKQISAECKRKNHLVCIDLAYQGFATGDVAADGAAVSQFVKDGHQIAVSQSFSKNFGLYGHRVGLLSVVTESAEEAARVESQLKILARPMYSNPPIHGARIVSIILGDEQLKQQWFADVKEMADRIISMRKALRDQLTALGSKHNWQHITDQIGMFCYSGLTSEQVDIMINKYHIYLTSNGRISMAGLTSKDIFYLATAIHEVTK